ncbi:MAG: hypothetical protein WBN78_00970, partial [Gammaproteobacteria bacterium]
MVIQPEKTKKGAVYMPPNDRHRISVIYLFLTLLFSLVPLSASAEGGVVERTPDNNDTLRPFINAQFGLFLGGTAAGFIPEPISSLS